MSMTRLLRRLLHLQPKADITVVMSLDGKILSESYGTEILRAAIQPGLHAHAAENQPSTRAVKQTT